MKIINLNYNDITRLYHMLNVLDDETDFMMYEPGERKLDEKGYEDLRRLIENAASGKDLLIAAEEDGGRVGFLSAERGKLNRVKHTAYVVCGVLRDYRGRGVGSELLKQLDQWAMLNDVVRLELTVECRNDGAKRLYEKNGFAVEGVRRGSMKVNGSFADEYYMGKIFN